jgi:hypothetical protein
MNQKLPDDLTEEQIREIIDHYENQTEDEAVAEDEAAFSDPNNVVVLVPREILPEVIRVIQRFEDNKLRKAKRTK